MNELALKLDLPKIPKKWNYDKSTAKIKTYIYKWKMLTKEMANELWIAREKLSIPPEKAAQKHETNDPRFNWTNYCKEIGSCRRSVNRWLALWFPKTLLEPDIDNNAPLGGKYFKLGVGDINNPPKFIPSKVDYIITDPPYGREFLGLYAQLAKFAANTLKKTGSLIFMTGHSYLPDIFRILEQCIELTYYWTSAYLTPGQAPAIWGKRINSNWKPLIWYIRNIKPERTVTDVFKSDRNDKRFHEWGQSISGMADIIEKITKPTDVIIDPFLGGGATAEAAVRLKRFIYGFDVDVKAIDITKTRLRKIKTDDETRA